MFGFFRKKEDKIPKAELDWFRQNGHTDKTSFTPDVYRIEGREWCVVFLYDEIMRDRRLYDKIRDNSVNLATAYTRDRDMAMWKKKVGLESFPIPLKGADKIPASRFETTKLIHKMDPTEIDRLYLGRIKGELHAVRPSVMFELDKYYLNGIEFERKRIRAIVPYHIQQGSVGIDANEFIATVRCWMWLGIKDHWINQLDGGFLFRPVSAFTARYNSTIGSSLGLYYCYTRLEYGSNY